MRSFLLQLSTPSGTPSDWVELDLFAGDTFPNGVRANAGCFQGDVFEGFDRLVVWTEGDELVVAAVCDDPSDWSGSRWARVVRYLPLAPDPEFGGAYNKRRTQTLYGEGASAVSLSDFGEVLPFDDLPELEGEEIRGIWVSDEQYRAHQENRRLADWKEWTHGVPVDDLDENGRIPPQRALGRYNVPKGTRTYFLRSDPLPTGVHPASNENAMVRDLPGPSDSQLESVGGNAEVAWIFTTEAIEPQLLQWPAGEYRVQLDVPAAGVDVLFGPVLLDATNGHFGRVDAALSSELESLNATQGPASGAGLHMFTVQATWTDFNLGDRYEIAVAAVRNTGHGNQDVSLRFSADCFADGPWPGGSSTSPTFVQVEFAELGSIVQSVDVDLVGDQTENAELN